MGMLQKLIKFLIRIAKFVGTYFSILNQEVRGSNSVSCLLELLFLLLLFCDFFYTKSMHIPKIGFLQNDLFMHTYGFLAVFHYLAHILH